MQFIMFVSSPSLSVDELHILFLELMRDDLQFVTLMSNRLLPHYHPQDHNLNKLNQNDISTSDLIKYTNCKFIENPR